MKSIKFFRLLQCSSLILLYSFLKCHTLSIPEKESLRLRLLEFDRGSGRLVQVLTSKNSDVIDGEDFGQESNIVLECRSGAGSVTFAYKGDGVSPCEVSKESFI